MDIKTDMHIELGMGERILKIKENFLIARPGLSKLVLKKNTHKKLVLKANCENHLSQYCGHCKCIPFIALMDVTEIKDFNLKTLNIINFIT